MPDTRPLAAETYVSLRSFRRDGTPVDTPVWVVGEGRRLLAFTDGTAWKVKRIRRNSRVEIAPCDVVGRVSGDWVRGTASIVDDPATERAAYAAFDAKYGWQKKLLDLGSWLGGRIDRRAVIEITLDHAT